MMNDFTNISSDDIIDVEFDMMLEAYEDHRDRDRYDYEDDFEFDDFAIDDDELSFNARFDAMLAIAAYENSESFDALSNYDIVASLSKRNMQRRDKDDLLALRRKRQLAKDDEEVSSHSDYDAFEDDTLAAR